MAVGVGITASGYLDTGGSFPVYTDDFNRSNTAVGDGTGLGSNWTVDGSGAGNDWYISSNTARKAAGDHFTKYDQDLGSPDHFVEAIVNGIATGNDYIVLNCRGLRTANSDEYQCYIDPTGNFAWIGKRVGGTFSSVSSVAFTHGSGPYTMRLEVQGTAQRLYIDGLLKLTTGDTSITTGNYAGMNCNEDVAAGGCSYDDFKCGRL